MSSTGVREENNDRKRTIRGLIKNEEQFIQSLRIFANTSTLSGLGSTGGESNNSPLDASGNYFARAGDFMIGQYGDDFAIAEINGGILDVSKAMGFTSPLIILNPEGGIADDLDTILTGSDVFSFQRLRIRTASENITFTELGNIITPQGGGFVVPPDSIVELVFDTVLQVWRIISATNGIGGGGTGITLPIDFPITFLGTIGFITQIIDFSLSTRHGWKAEFNGDVELAFTNPPTGELGLATFKFKQDVTGGHTLTLPAGTVNKDIVEAGFLLGSNEETGIVIEFFNDTFYAFLATGNIVSGGGGGSGDVVGPASSTDNAIVRFDGVTGKLIQNSGILISDTDALSGVTGIDLDGANATIQGVQLLDLFQANQQIESLSGGIEYSVGDLQSHLFKSLTDDIAQFEESSAGVFRLNMLDHSIRNSKDIAFDVAALFAGSGSVPTIGYDAGSSEWRFNHPSGGEIRIYENNVMGTTNFKSNSLATDLLTANDFLLLGVHIAPTILGQMSNDGTDILAFSGGSVRNLSNIPAATPATRELDNLTTTDINVALLPQASATLDLGSELLPWRIGHFREIEFPVTTGDPGPSTDTQISVNTSNNMAFNNAVNGGGYLWYFEGVQKWAMTSTQFSGDFILLQNSLTFNDSGTNTVGNGEITRNGTTMQIQSSVLQSRADQTGVTFGQFQMIKLDPDPDPFEPIYDISWLVFDTPTTTAYATIRGTIIDPTDAGQLDLQVRADNSLISAFTIRGRTGSDRFDISCRDETIIKAGAGNMGFFVTNDPGILDNIGNFGTIQIPQFNDGSPSLTDLNQAFGAFDGAIGQDISDGKLYVRKSSTIWSFYSESGTVT